MDAYTLRARCMKGSGLEEQSHSQRACTEVPLHALLGARQIQQKGAKHRHVDIISWSPEGSKCQVCFAWKWLVRTIETEHELSCNSMPCWVYESHTWKKVTWWNLLTPVGIKVPKHACMLVRVCINLGRAQACEHNCKGSLKVENQMHDIPCNV